MILSRRVLLSLLLPAFFVFVSGCSERAYFTRRSFTMGTFLEVTCPSENGTKIVFEEFKRLEGILSNFSDTSEVSRLNKTGRLYVGRELKALIKKSIQVSRESNGAFDITCAPLVDIWKKAIHDKVLPEKKEINRALSLVGYKNIYIDENTGLVIFLKKNMAIDLGAIAKGFAIDSAIEKLKALGVNSALINAGGEIYCLGTRSGRPWKVAIQDPRKSKDTIAVLPLSNKAISTSGDYQQFFEIKDKRYSHIIDPHTGYPVDNGLIQVTVVADDATTADFLSTAVFVLGEKEGLKLTKKFNATKVRIVRQ